MDLQLLNPRQIAAFKRRKRGYYSLWIVIGLVCLSILAPLLANNKPLVMNYDGEIYFPVFQDLHPSELNLDSNYALVNFRELQTSEKMGWSLWPPIPWHPNESDRSISGNPPFAPSSAHLFGTDNRSRDVLARVLFGLRNSLLFAFAVWFFGYIIGILIGSFQGYYGGKIDFVGQRVIEVYQAIPGLLVIMIVSSILSPNLFLLATILVVLGGWIGISYYMRASFLQLRKREFVEAARAQGLSTPKIMLRHILPNSLTPIITVTPFSFTGAIFSLTSLDFLGFGLPPPSASWGELLNQGQNYITANAWWLIAAPSGALAFTLIVLNFVGESLREAFDPRSADS